MTAAAMTWSSAPVPKPLVAEFRRAVRMMALDGRQHAHDDEGPHDRAARVDAGQLGRLRVAADGVDVAPEAPTVGEDGHEHGHADHDEHRVGDARSG